MSVLQNRTINPFSTFLAHLFVIGVFPSIQFNFFHTDEHNFIDLICEFLRAYLLLNSRRAECDVVFVRCHINVKSLVQVSKGKSEKNKYYYFHI